MPLDPVNFHPLGPVKSADLLQFYQVLTGVMADQPVTFRNALSIGGDQSVTTIPLRVYGAPSQNTNLIDLYPDRTSAQPGFGFGAAGQFAWGPGGSSPQDTFLSRIGLQNGHAADTAGLLVTPGLEVDGEFSIDGDLRLRGDGTYIYGNFTGPAEINRVSFQTTVDNGMTIVQALPDGTSKQAGFAAFNSPDPSAAAYAVLVANDVGVGLVSNKTGAGVLLPLTFNIGGTERARFQTNGWFEALTGGRFSGAQPPIPPVGAGVEVFCFPPGTAGMEAQGRGYIQSYNRAGAGAWVDLYISGKTIQLNPEAGVAVAGRLTADYLSAAVALTVTSTPPPITTASFTTGQLQLTGNANPPQISFHYAGVIGASLYLVATGLSVQYNSGGPQTILTDTNNVNVANKNLIRPGMYPAANSGDLTNNFMVFATGSYYLPAPNTATYQQRWVKAWGGTLTLHVVTGFGLYGPGETGPNRADPPAGDGVGIVLANGNSVHLYCDGGNWWVI